MELNPSEMSVGLEREFAYYKTHQDELVRLHEGKFLVIVGETVVSTHDSDLEAYETAKKIYQHGSFFIQHCQAGKDSYMQTFHTRVTFQ